ncbi:hypothetical protein MLD38_024250 [Melastoma candidum]|uniref:Uncharacterized protein n=1 Tax=Melastoma candidum TaxID=119954 RepID=A0ACB9NYG1_9MYRT|nr:hypothetical protein MLD38_024250 [Melastoma candidum]
MPSECRIQLSITKHETASKGAFDAKPITKSHRRRAGAQVGLRYVQSPIGDEQELRFQDSELFESLKVNDSIGWAVDVIDLREFSCKVSKVNLSDMSHDSTMGLVQRFLEMGILLTEVYEDKVGDVEKYRLKLSERFPSIEFMVSKKTDSLYPVVAGASIVAKFFFNWVVFCAIIRARALRDWVRDDTPGNIVRNFGSGYPADPETRVWLEKGTTHPVFGFPIRFSWGTCKPFFSDSIQVTW